MKHREGEPTFPKPLRFVGNARREISEMPLPVKTRFGYDLRDVQNGETPGDASPFEGSRANAVMKLTARHDGDTFRCVYAARFPKAVYVLYVFQKKSHSGIATPQKDIDAVYARYSQAHVAYEAEFGPLDAH